MDDTERVRLSGLGLEIFDPAPVAVAVTRGWHHTLVYTNDQFRALFGERPIGLPLLEAFPDLLEVRYLDRLDDVLSTGEPSTSTSVPIMIGHPRGEPEERYFNVSLSTITTDQGEHGVLLVAADVTDQVTASDQIRILSEERRRALQRYESLVATGAQHVWVADAAGRVIESGGAWEQVTGRSWEEVRGHGWLASAHPTDRGRLTRAWFRAVEEVPDLFQGVYRIRTPDGTYRHIDIRAVPIREQDLVIEWVGTCSDVEDQWLQERRSQLLTRAAAVVTHTRRPQDAFAALSRVIVPTLADACCIYLLPEPVYPSAGGRPTIVDRVAATAREGLPPGLPPLREEHIPRDSAFARAVRERRPVHATFAPGSVPEDIETPGMLHWLTLVGAHNGVLVPVLVDGTVAAVVAAFVTGERDPIGPAEMALMSELLGLAHDTLSNAMQLQRAQRVALALQHSLLTDPPTPDELELQARYLPSPAAAEVGGDWYDSFVLPDGMTVMIIGDVAGHDLAAAVTMGKMRNMLRALAADRQAPPGEMLRRLDTATQILTPEEATATCIYARVEGEPGGPWQLNYSVAGHVPPLLVEADGSARFLLGAHNPLLGLAPNQPRISAIEPLPPGATLLLYTDGLIERHDEDLDDGLGRLLEHASALADAPLDAFCDELLAKHAASGDDDMALIALRLPPERADS
ncbi:MAG TPA: SpoIIE family protein phosphatase [Actinopolymorphaceae bacterium]